jgi:alpha-L-fucosidase
MAHNDMDENERLAMMNEKYSRLEAEYNHVVQELQGSEEGIKIREEHEELLKYTQQLQTYIEQLEAENNNLMRGMKTSVDESKSMLEPELAQKLADKDNEIKSLTQLVYNLEEKVKQGDGSRPKSSISKDLHTSQLENQIH